MWISKKKYKESLDKKVIDGIRKMTIKEIQAIQEGERKDILTSNITGTSYGIIGDSVLDKNNYPTYTNQIQTINRMYNSETDYGAEILKSIIDTRVSFIGGAGISIRADNKKTHNFILHFLSCNKILKGSNLFNIIKIGEMEGKILLVLNKKKNYLGEFIHVNICDWYNNPYNVQMKNKEIIGINLSTSDQNELFGKDNYESAREIPISRSVYLKVGGSPDRTNETPPRISNILTDIVNLSRAKGDMRGNNHLYGKPQWTALTNTKDEAKALSNTIAGRNMDRNQAFVGTVKELFYLEPSGKAQEVLEKEILLLARIISLNTGIPIQWLAWPDLMSNRATAETMLETINAATVQERLIYEEGLTELVRKAMQLAIEFGIEDAVNDPWGFELKMDLVSYANLKQISETWIPLAEDEYISKETAMSMIPGVNPSLEKKIIEKEKKKKMPSIMSPSIIEEEITEKEIENENSKEYPKKK